MAARVEHLTSQSTPGLRPTFRILAAEALRNSYPKLADSFVRAALEDVRERDEIDDELLSALTSVAPEQTIALLPHLQPGAEYTVGNVFMQSNQVRRAAALYRTSWERVSLGSM